MICNHTESTKTEDGDFVRRLIEFIGKQNWYICWINTLIEYHNDLIKKLNDTPIQFIFKANITVYTQTSAIQIYV